MDKEKKEPMKIKLSTAILVFIILILIIAIVGVVYYYQNKITNNENNLEKENQQSENVSKVNEINIAKEDNKVQENKIQTLDIINQTVQDLYKYIEKPNNYQELLVYQSNKVTAKDMSNTLKLATIFSNLKESEADDRKVVEEHGTEITNLYYKTSTVEDKAKEIFGEDITIKHEDLPDGLSYAIKYENGQYHCFNFQGGGGFLWEESINSMEKAEEDNENIYIYEKYAHIYMNFNDNAESNYDIYSSSDKKEKLASNIDYTKIYNGTNGLVNTTERNKKMMENVEKITNNKIKTFKHTFKKNQDGSYYWYSTEPVE